MARTGIKAPAERAPEPPPAPAYVLPRTPQHERPLPPKHLPPYARDAWRKLWAAPVAGVWNPGSDDLCVALLSQCYSEIMHGDPSAETIKLAVQLADRLLLNPRARRLSRVVIDDVLFTNQAPPEPPAPEPVGPDDERRAHLLRLAN
jgi:hypothetical protein